MYPISYVIFHVFWLHICLCTVCICSACRCQKKVPGLKPESQTVLGWTGREFDSSTMRQRKPKSKFFLNFDPVIRLFVLGPRSPLTYPKGHCCHFQSSAERCDRAHYFPGPFDPVFGVSGRPHLPSSSFPACSWTSNLWLSASLCLWP